MYTRGFIRRLSNAEHLYYLVGLAEDHEQVARAGVLQGAGHVQVGTHTHLEDRDAVELAELGGVRLGS